MNFSGNTEYNDGFSYENWGGYNLLVKLNQRNPEVQNYICDVIRFWVSEFDVDGIRLDAADVLDFDFMKQLRRTAEEVKPDFWLMGEVIHGDYSRWVNGSTLHSVTNYALHKALYSGHNDHNYFEIAHTVKYLQNMGDLDLYNLRGQPRRRAYLHQTLQQGAFRSCPRACSTPFRVFQAFTMVLSSESRAARREALTTAYDQP